MLTVILLGLVAALLFGVIACDECRRLKRQLDILDDQVAELLDSQVAHERQHEADRETAMLRRRAQAPTRRGQELPSTTRDPALRQRPALEVVTRDTSGGDGA